MSKIKELKTVNPFFQDIKKGRKSFEVRFNDRNFDFVPEVGQVIHDPEMVCITSAGEKRGVSFVVTYVLSHEDFHGVKPGCSVFSFQIA